MEWIVREPEQIVLVSTFKGWLFVAVTSLLLYGLMRRLPGGAAGELKHLPVSRLRRLLPLILIAASIAVLTVGSMLSTFKREKDKQVDRLQAIADLKAGQIEGWLREKDGDGRIVQNSHFFSESYRRWRHAGDHASGEVLKKRLTDFSEERSFEGLLLLDEQNAVLWESEGIRTASHPPLQAATLLEASGGSSIRIGPYRDTNDRLHLDLAVPLLLVGSRPAPSVVLHVDPETYLYPTLQAWPVPSPSGETLLFRRDGEDVLFLNELRHRKNTAAKLRLPLAERELLAARVIRGEVTLGSAIEGVDYRGVPVVGVARGIPGTDWFLVSKVDQSELYGEAAHDALWIALTGVLALLMVGTGYFLSRKSQELAFSRRERETQAEKLRALQLLDAIAESSGDAIYAKDRDGRYLLFNREAARVVGKSPNEVLGGDDLAIFPPDEAASLMAGDRQVMTENRGVTFQLTLRLPVRIMAAHDLSCLVLAERTDGRFGSVRTCPGEGYPS